MSDYILAINPGSTTTKVGLFEDEDERVSETIEHDRETLDSFHTVGGQFAYRKALVMDFLDGSGIDQKLISCVIGRGGLGLKPVSSGGYIVNDLMVDRLLNSPFAEHASNLGGPISRSIADSLGIKAYIYDAVATDELDDVARITGLPLIDRKSAFHALNTRAMAIHGAKMFERPFTELNIIVAHLGGGSSLCLFSNGRAIDICSDDEGPFSVERAGVLPANKLVDLCFWGGLSYDEIKKMLRGRGGVRAHLDTSDMIAVEQAVKDGDERTIRIIDAMIYQTAKAIGSLATVVNGSVDGIIITGSVSRDQYICEGIRKRVSFIAPVSILPGEDEMQALASGALRILHGEETPRIYTE